MYGLSEFPIKGITLVKIDPTKGRVSLSSSPLKVGFSFVPSKHMFHSSGPINGYACILNLKRCGILAVLKNIVPAKSMHLMKIFPTKGKGFGPQ